MPHFQNEMDVSSSPAVAASGCDLKRREPQPTPETGASFLPATVEDECINCEQVELLITPSSKSDDEARVPVKETLHHMTSIQVPTERPCCQDETNASSLPEVVASDNNVREQGDSHSYDGDIELEMEICHGKSYTDITGSCLL